VKSFINLFLSWHKPMLELIHGRLLYYMKIILIKFKYSWFVIIIIIIIIIRGKAKGFWL